jgi:Ras-related protein Rab-21
MSGRSFKVVLLGEGRVGKSSIILRFMHNKYDDRQQSTLSASCFDKSISLGGAETARISLWDTAGQERFHALGPLYYRDAGAWLRWRWRGPFEGMAGGKGSRGGGGVAPYCT